MKNQNYLKQTLSLLAAAVSLLGAATSQAAIFHVEIDTASLLSLPASAAGPFSLDFQLNGGTPLGNSVTIGNFDFDGGSPSGSPATFGLGSGNLASFVSLSSDSSNAFNEFFQGFTPGGSLGFDVSITANINIPVPDLFSVGILDGSLQNIPTTGLGNSLAIFEVDSTPQAAFFSGTGDFASVAAVPEPGTALWGAGLGLVAAFRRTRSRRV